MQPDPNHFARWLQIHVHVCSLSSWLSGCPPAPQPGAPASSGSQRRGQDKNRRETRFLHTQPIGVAVVV
jgi:hypothetical protein